ncbi:MAG: TIGR02594 family protein [Pseudomonadota bacterium]
MSAYEIARTYDGLYEWKDGHNPQILKWFAAVGHSWVADDETAWCAAFVGGVLHEAGMPHTGKLTARSYLDWGVPVDLPEAREGDVVIFSRGDPAGWQGHVGFFVRREGDKIVCFGGNQNNQVNERSYPVNRLLGIRRLKAVRTKKRESTTLQAATVASGTTVTGVAAVLGQLSSTAQIVALFLAAVILLALGYIARERLRKWAEGDR